MEKQTRAPRFITSIAGRVKQLSGERTIPVFAKKNNMTVDEAKRFLIDRYNNEVVAPARAEHAEQRRLAKLELIRLKNQTLAVESVFLSEIDFTHPPTERSELGIILDQLYQFMGQVVVAVWRVNGQYVNSFRYELPTIPELGPERLEAKLHELTPEQRQTRRGRNALNRYMRPLWQEHYWHDSDHTIFEEVRLSGLIPQTLSFYRGETIEPSNITQFFLDGDKHCVLHPIYEWARRKLEDTTLTYKTKSKYTVLMKKSLALIEDYKTGVPESEIQTVCDKLRIDINIYQPFSKTPELCGKSKTCRIRSFNYMNTRINHVEEYGGLSSLDDPICKSREELTNMVTELTESGEYFTYMKDKVGISRVSTINATYKLDDNYREICSNFEREVGLDKCYICDIKDKDVSEFVQSGVRYNGTVDMAYSRDFVEVETLNHIDQEKAYANFKKCPLYNGFLGKITDFRECTKMNGVGYYRIQKLSWQYANKKFTEINKLMNIYVNGEVYPSPDLDLLTKHGVYFEVDMGCWGSSIDFDFNQDMLKKSDGIANYAKWTGGQDSHHLYKRFYMYGNHELCSIIAKRPGVKIERYTDTDTTFGEVLIGIPKKTNRTMPHITGFITAYQRCNTILQLMTMNIDKVHRVCVDGIYTHEWDIPCDFGFRVKNGEGDRNLKNEPAESYVSPQRFTKFNPGPIRAHHMKTLHLGGGGCGKTHTNLTDTGYVRLLYVGPTYKLIRAKKAEYNCDAVVLAHLWSDVITKIDYVNQFNCFLIDECSMITKKALGDIFKRFPNHKFIVCGDIGYQLPPYEGEACDEDMFSKVIRYNTDYRCKCKKLSAIKQQLRDMIDEGTMPSEMKKWALANLRVISVDELQELYQIEDMLLSGTNAMRHYYSDLFKGKFDKEKYYITETNREYSNGDIIISDTAPEAKCEVRHCFTVHSIQGETCKNKLFIDNNSLFDPCSLYTAISRAERLDQVYIINNDHNLKLDGKIYRIDFEGKTYIGSTTLPLNERLKSHKQAKRAYLKGTGRRLTSFELLDGTISLIESFPCDDVKDLRKRETEYIKAMDCVNKTGNNQ